MRRKKSKISVNPKCSPDRRIRFAAIVLAITLITWLGAFSFTGEARAASASLYLAPSGGNYAINKTFNVSVRVNSGGQVINAAEGTISYDTNLLDVTGVSKGGSIFPFWTAEPGHSGGTIRFGGGLPPPGYNGTGGTIITVTFKTKRAGDAVVRFTGGAVLASDGKGTNILGSMGSAKYTISPTVTGSEPAKPAAPAAEKVETEYNKPVITSPSHPDQSAWYRLNKVEFKWEPPKGVTGVSFSFDQNPQSDPGNTDKGLLGEQTLEADKDGVWYFHLKYKDSRRWGTIAHYRVMIDTTPPKPFEVEIRRIELNDWPELHFEAKDETSGIKGYEVIINSLVEQGHGIEADKPFLKITGLEVGRHAALVKAIDKAGNETLVQTEFTIDPIEAPVITDYPAELKSADRFYAGGSALPEAVIFVYIEKESGEHVIASTTSDGRGSWLYLHRGELANGRYLAWAEAMNDKGLKSGPSNKVTFLVSPPVFTRLGSIVINYFTVFTSLLFLIVLIIALVLYLFGFFRRKLKKETFEIEAVLRKNFIDLHAEVDRGLDKLEKAGAGPGYRGEKARIKERLRSNIDQAEQKILKEIKDVEDVLK